MGVPGDADGSSRSARARRTWNLGETPTHAETVRSASSDASAVDGAGARRRGDAVHDERPAETRAEAGDDSRATSSRPPTRRRRRSRIAADATASPARMLKSRIARGDVWEEGGRTTRRTSTHTSDVIRDTTMVTELDLTFRNPRTPGYGRSIRRSVSSDAAAPRAHAHALVPSRAAIPHPIPSRGVPRCPPLPPNPRASRRVPNSPLHHSSGRGAFCTLSDVVS